MERRKETAAIIIFMVVGIFLGYTIGHADKWKYEAEKADTAVVTWAKADTSRISRPKPVQKLQLPDVMKIRIPTPVYIRNRTESKTEDPGFTPGEETRNESRDSIDIELPVEQKTYTDSTRYRLVVSGYNVNLEELEIYNKTEYREITITKTRKKRWEFGAAAGPTITTRGLDFGITFGVVYNF